MRLIITSASQDRLVSIVRAALELAGPDGQIVIEVPDGPSSKVPVREVSSGSNAGSREALLKEQADILKGLLRKVPEKRQDEVAVELGISPPTLSGLANGGWRVNPGLLERFPTVFGVATGCRELKRLSEISLALKPARTRR